MNNKKITLVLPSVIVAIMVVFLIMALNNKDTLNQANMEEKTFPAFVLKALQTEQVLTESLFLEQDHTLLNVWASWCVVCKAEHPFLVELAAQGVNIVGLNYRDNIQSAISVLTKTGNPYQQVIFDEQGKLALDLGVIGTPETYLINGQGKIIRRFNGVLTEKVWASLFAPHIKQRDSKGDS